MRILLNLLWATIGGGAVIAAQYLLGGCLLCLTVVGIPFGVQCFRMAGLSLFPFGKEVVDADEAHRGGFVHLLMNVVWFLCGGLSTFVSHIGIGALLSLSIVGIPFALQHLKLAVFALFPFDRRVVSVA